MFAAGPQVFGYFRTDSEICWALVVVVVMLGRRRDCRRCLRSPYYLRRVMLTSVGAESSMCFGFRKGRRSRRIPQFIQPRRLYPQPMDQKCSSFARRIRFAVRPSSGCALRGESRSCCLWAWALRRAISLDHHPVAHMAQVRTDWDHSLAAAANYHRTFKNEI